MKTAFCEVNLKNTAVKFDKQITIDYSDTAVKLQRKYNG